MVDATQTLYAQGKKSLDSLLREKAYAEVKSNLEDKGIDINDVSDEDIETLVASQASEMKNTLKSFSVGVALSGAVSLLSGV